MHRDIKPNNILITDDGHVALADFGIAHVEPDITPLFSSSSSYSASPIPEVHLTELAGGTDAYQAPELIQCMHDPDASYTCKVDVWAVGVVMYEMALGLEGPWFTDRGRGRLCRGGGRNGEYDATSQLVDTWARILDGEFDWERVEGRDSKLADLLKKVCASVLCDSWMLMLSMCGVGLDVSSESKSTILSRTSHHSSLLPRSRLGRTNQRRSQRSMIPFPSSLPHTTSSYTIYSYDVSLSLNRSILPST